MGLIESIRRWIDGETTDDILEEADEHTKPRRVWEEFLVKIAREVEACMQREMFTPPGGPTYIPREYIVYLSNDDDQCYRATGGYDDRSEFARWTKRLERSDWAG